MKYGGLEIRGNEANFVFYGADGQRFLEPAQKCQECDATGEVEGEKAVVDYVNGGYLVEVVDTCEKCEGMGYVIQEG